MDSNEQEIPPVKGKANHHKGLTVMIVGSVGKVRSFKISGRGIFWVAIFFLGYITTSIIIINSFFDIRRQYSSLAERFKQAESDLSDERKDRLISEQHVALMDDYAQDLQKQLEEKHTRAKVENTQTKNIGDRIKEETPVDRVLEKRSAMMVAIEDVVIQKEGSWMTVDFKLANLQPGENAIVGYIHIIAESTQTDPPQIWSYPKEKLKDGVPVNFNRGELFIIKRFKPIQGRIDLAPSRKLPSSIRILVYDQSGGQILDKEFEVSNAS